MRPIPLPNSVSSWLAFPPDISREGHRIDDAFRLTTWLTGAYFLVVVAALAAILLVYRARAGHRAVYDRGDGRVHLLVIGALALTVFLTVDLNLVGKSIADLKVFQRAPRDPNALRVEVLAQQFAWNVRYPGPDDRFGTADDALLHSELRIPVGRPVLVQLRSKDVVHSLYLPNFRIKQDATPGMTSSTWFEATSQGRFEFGCAELCGPFHYRMRGDLFVQSAADFGAWYREASAQAARAFDPEDLAAAWGWEWRTR